MVDITNKPQILEHLNKSLPLTIYDTKWIPSSARFVCLGSHARGTGAIQVYELEEHELKLVAEWEKKDSIKCGTFGASPLDERHLATGDFMGNLHVWDLDNNMGTPVFHVKAHDSIINAIDGIGGLGGKGYGAPELVTGSRDGRVRVWDSRQREAPVAAFEPAQGEVVRDCWAVAFGNSYGDDDRCVAAGYDNGDVKVFDLRNGKTFWETNVKNGVCAVQFDRPDIQMNKLLVATLESRLSVFDCRTLHPEKGFADVTEKGTDNSTIWTGKHLPQNRDIFMTSGGDGSVNLYKYCYPEKRSVRDAEDKFDQGVAGTLELLNTRVLSSQPISCWDWSPDKAGLACCGAFDQTIRVVICTKLR